LDLTDLVEIGGEEALVAQVVRGFVEAGLGVGGDGEHTRIASQRCIVGVTRRSLITDQQLLRFVVFQGNRERKVGSREAVRRQIRDFVFDEVLRRERRNRRKETGYGVLVGRQLRGSN